MTTFRLPLLAILTLAACLLPASRPAHAAETYHTCAGFIDSIPAVITTQGVWCLRHDLNTNISSSSAITIATNNVTIDCNDFKLGGLSAGNGSQANGIYGINRQNSTIRHCNVRGFSYGIRLISSAGSLVEDNRLDNNLYTGIQISGDNNVIRGNRVYDTGGRTGSGFSYGIVTTGTTADIMDNVVAGLFADVSGGYLRGIDSGADNARVSGNSISGYDLTAVQGGAVGHGAGIFTSGQHTRVSSNQISGGDLAAIPGTGISVNGGVYSSAYCLDNTVGGFATGLFQCSVSDGNLTLP